MHRRRRRRAAASGTEPPRTSRSPGIARRYRIAASARLHETCVEREQLLEVPPRHSIAHDTLAHEKLVGPRVGRPVRSLPTAGPRGRIGPQWRCREMTRLRSTCGTSPEVEPAAGRLPSCAWTSSGLPASGRHYPFPLRGNRNAPRGRASAAGIGKKAYAFFSASSCLRICASTAAIAVMFRIRREVALVVRMCTGLFTPIRIGPIATPSVNTRTRL